MRKFDLQAYEKTVKQLTAALSAVKGAQLMDIDLKRTGG